MSSDVAVRLTSPGRHWLPSPADVSRGDSAAPRQRRGLPHQDPPFNWFRTGTPPPVQRLRPGANPRFGRGGRRECV